MLLHRQHFTFTYYDPDLKTSSVESERSRKILVLSGMKNFITIRNLFDIRDPRIGSEIDSDRGFGDFIAAQGARAALITREIPFESQRIRVTLVENSRL